MWQRAALMIMVPVWVFGFGGTATAHAPTPTTDGTPSPASGGAVCRITDPRVTEVSGLVATGSGYVVVNDSNIQRSRVKIFFLDRSCALTRQVSYPTNALDPEDLAMARDGTLWVADIGDNSPLTGGSGTRRTTIALWSLAPDATTPVIHRVVYPDGRPRDAETLLLNGDGSPVIITKEPAGEVYVANGPLKADNTVGVPLRRVGTFTPAVTGTANPLGFIGAGLVTGGAVAPDGSRAVVRTMSDAYEFDVSGGDVAAAVTTGTPRITALPDEPQGEAISYTADGRFYLTGSDQAQASTILRYVPTPAVPATASATPRPGAQTGAKRSGPVGLSVEDVTWIVAGFGGLGIVLLALGIIGVVWARIRGRSRSQKRSSLELS